MSHYTVAVISPNNDEATIGQLLDPFYEELEVEQRSTTLDNGTIHTYWCNPKAKWDWYTIGGRWNNYLTDKSGLRTNSTKIKDLDFKPDLDLYNRSIRKWELLVEGAEPITEDDKEIVSWNRYKPEYYTSRFNNKEHFAMSTAEPLTYAILTPDGEWHAPGDMGWFGMSDESNEAAKEWDADYYEFIMSQNSEHYITIVDCHI